MPDQYYSDWTKKRRAERRAYAKAKRLGGKAWNAWQRAAERLVKHENDFGVK